MSASMNPVSPSVTPPPDKRIILEASGLSKRFGGLLANDDVSLSLGTETGKVTSVIGPNGAGKSTFFKMLAGFCTPTTGKVRLFGEDITGLNPHKISARGLVRTFQETTIFPELTALEHVALARQLSRSANDFQVFANTASARRDEDRMRTDALEILRFLDLDGVADSVAKTLPHGYLRLLGIAMGMAASPKVLLLDEPYAGLNPDETDRAVELTRKIAASGVSILLVEHDMKAVMKISDHIHVLYFGKKIAEGSPEEIRNNEQVIEAYLGKEDEDIGL
ncbi:MULTISPECIES: ABC transporter ATP-binding protein [unclassified Herbaspirillum]|uniref:ABC transporter ATP-binding protein n=1 Tax=unclassified Herbaspirillum TaxID=2624150 RepID=UPI000E2FA310|nr:MULTISPECIES: ABC transporter ATP-binding protein [unclassified Herbaspirillum]RFB65771.1 ABC transporter ATP-binding protein [Herbaspirillum sp. 3R-3a1]TFI08924.1 ABC transporter ATP-binding protein [Herbaspirillum sp. 3R11]TFI15342.1 ABC transporter ATP-binding protein [Herbaspirillum sp. 3R-11]TFI24135.1 ABC transporter ATP-binding protein [Herbaspirillum sp. 3C11]